MKYLKKKKKIRFTLTIFAGDGFGPRFAAGTNSWVEPARNRNNTLQCSCPATVSAFTETRTGPFSPSLPTRFTCSCKRKFVQYGWVGSEPGPLFYDPSAASLSDRAVKGATFSKGCARKVERSIRRRLLFPAKSVSNERGWG